MARRSLVKEALNTPYTEWKSIESLMELTDNEHIREVLRRMMEVKRRRAENNGN